MMITSEIKITVWAGDALTLCTLRLPEEKTFHFIDTSNLSDTLGLLNILVCCSTRLKRSGVLLTQTFDLSDKKTPAEYLQNELCIDTDFYPTLLGLRLADDFEIGKEYMRAKSLYKDVVELRWFNCNHICDSVDIRNSPELLGAFSNLAKICLRTFKKPIQALQCPLTLILIIKRISYKIKGGAKTLTKIAEKCLEVDIGLWGSLFTPLKMEWDMLKSIHLQNHDTKTKLSDLFVVMECPVSRMAPPIFLGEDNYFRCKIWENRQEPVFHVTTILRYEHETEKLSLILPWSFVLSFFDDVPVQPCNADGSPSYLYPFVYNSRCRGRITAIPFHNVIDLKCNYSETKDIRESKKTLDFSICNDSSSVALVQYMVIKGNSKLVSVTLTSLCSERFEDAQNFTVSFPNALKLEKKTFLMLPQKVYNVRLQKREDFHGMDILSRRQYRIDLTDQSLVTHSDKIDVLCNLMVMPYYGQDLEDSKHANIREVFQSLFRWGLKSLKCGNVGTVNILLGRIEGIIQPVGMFPEDITIYVLRIREEKGLPIIDCIYFDWEIAHERHLFRMFSGALPSIEIMKNMGYKTGINATLAVHGNVARQFKRILTMNTMLTQQTKGTEGQPCKWFFEVTLKPIFPYCSALVEMQQLDERFGCSPDDVPNNPTKLPQVKDLCSYCKSEGHHYKTCSQCKTVRYCSRECQKKDWKMHRHFCQRQCLKI